MDASLLCGIAKREGRKCERPLSFSTEFRLLFYLYYFLVLFAVNSCGTCIFNSKRPDPTGLCLEYSKHEVIIK